MLPVNEHTTTQNLAKGIEPEFLQAYQAIKYTEQEASVTAAIK